MVNINKNKVKKFKDLINDNNKRINKTKFNKNDKKIINFDVFLKNNRKIEGKINKKEDCNKILNRLKEKESKERDNKDNNEDNDKLLEKEEEINKFIIEIILQMGHVNNSININYNITISKRHLNQKVVDSSINRIDEASSTEYVDKLIKKFEEEKLLTCKHGMIYLKPNFSDEMFNKLHK